SSRSTTVSTSSTPATALDFDAYQRCPWTQSLRASTSKKDRSPPAMLRARSGIRLLQFLFVDQLEPIEAAGCQRQEIGKLTYPRKARPPEQLDRIAALEGRQVELHRLRRAGDVVHAQHHVVLEAADVGEDPRVRRLERLVAAEAEHRVLLAQRDEAVEPAQQGRGGAELRLDVHSLEAVDRVHQRRRVELREVGA